jgi:hypothetical protein
MPVEISPETWPLQAQTDFEQLLYLDKAYRTNVMPKVKTPTPTL